MCPLVFTHVLSALLMVYALYIGITCYAKLCRLEVYNMLVLVLLASIVLGVHGISHIEMKKIYGYTMLL